MVIADPEHAIAELLNSSTQVAPHWFVDVTSVLQRSVGDVTAARGHRFVSVLRHHLETIPRPANVAEQLVLRSVLFEMMLALSVRLHDWKHPAGALTCGFCALAVLARHGVSGAPEAIDGCLRWAQDYSEALDRSHPPTFAERSADWLDAHESGPYDARVLAMAMGCSRRHLARRFRERFGLTPRWYHECRRIARAADLLGSSKVESVLHAVGYRGNKDFYRAFKERAGITPGAYGTVRHAGGDGRWTCDRCGARATCTPFARARMAVVWVE